MLFRSAALAPDNARLLSGLDDAQMRWLYAHARALIAPAFEDFGLTPLEAYAFGTPVLARRGGGYLDTVVCMRSLTVRRPDLSTAMAPATMGKMRELHRP